MAVELADATTGVALTAYAPLVVAVGGLVAAFVAALGRRDKRRTDDIGALDAHANTAIKGLTEAYDRAEAERARWQAAAEEADRRADQAEAELARLHQTRRRSPRDVSSKDG